VSGGWAWDEPGRLHLRVDAAGVTTRLHAEGGGWVLRGGCVGRCVLWRRGAGPDEWVEGEAVALGFTGPHPAYDVAVALRLRLGVGDRQRVRLVEVTDPAPARWTVLDLATGEQHDPDPDTVVAGMAALGWPA
jgi:hypothetical protein